MQQISTGALEEAILALLCFSDEKAPTIAVKLPDSAIFTTPENKQLAQTAIEYIKKFSKAPKGQLEYLLEADMRRGERGKLLAQQFDFLSKQSQQVEAAFVLDQLERFISSQQLLTQLREALDLLNQGEFEKAQEAAYRQLVIPQNGDSEIWFKDSKQALSFLDRDEQDEFFSSGLDSLDLRGVRPERKTLFFIIAAAGRGKSWYLIECGKRALQHHHKVLHVTLEISKEKTAQRYVQSIFSLTKSEAESIRTPYFERAVDGSVSIQFRDITRESVIAKKKDITKRLQGMTSYPDLLIKEFPTASLSIEHLTLYLDQLEREKNFKPDMLILDYADLMRIDSEALRIDTGRLYRELRGLAAARNFALVTASQGNRQSEDAKLVTSTNVAEDWSKIGTADVVLTYSQTPEEFRLGLARVFVQKARDAGDRFIALISQAYKIGQFALDSVLMNVELARQLGEGEEKNGG